MSRFSAIRYSLFVVCFFPRLCAAAAAQGGVEFSTISAGRREDSPLMLNIEKDSRDSRVGLDYSIRWDFSDLAHIRPSLRTLADGIAALTRWDITENTRVKYYGFATNPWRIFIAREKSGTAAGAGATAGGGSAITEAGSERPVYKKRLRLSFSPLVDDFKRNLDDNLRDVLLQNSLKPAAGEQWEHVNTTGKKEFVRDLTSLDIWRLPGLDTTKKGLQYISR